MGDSYPGQNLVGASDPSVGTGQPDQGCYPEVGKPTSRGIALTLYPLFLGHRHPCTPGSTVGLAQEAGISLKPHSEWWLLSDPQPCRLTFY